jgi:hypothetical protein
MFPIMLGVIAAVIGKAIRDHEHRKLASRPPAPPAQIDPRWRTSDVIGLARGISEDQAFERLPILGDALMDAGCEGEQIIAHCRGEGPHVRGCWVVDLILGKD